MKHSPPTSFTFKDIVIRKPCHESWVEMLPEGGGRYCQLCQKMVVDFSQKTEVELNAILAQRKPGQRMCGRFRADQIGGSNPAAPAQLGKNFQWTRGAAAAFVLLGVWQGALAFPQLPTVSINTSSRLSSTDGGSGESAIPVLGYLISAVVLNEAGENIPDDIVLTLIFPGGRRDTITTQRGFFHLDTDASWKSTDKVTVEIKAQVFEDNDGKRDYKSSKQSFSLTDTQNWAIKVSVKYEFYEMLMGDYDPGF